MKIYINLIGCQSKLYEKKMKKNIIIYIVKFVVRQGILYFLLKVVSISYYLSLLLDAGLRL